MKKPNFFIIGAPKCGTTSLYAWLSTHPQIFMPSNKEPHHFNSDENWTFVNRRDHYERLFKCATKDHKAVGEASVWYLFSEAAVPNIEEYVDDARYIVCLRNPIEMAYSLHEQHIFSGIEHVKDFEEAWDLQEERLQGGYVNRWCKEPRHLSYGAVCKLGQQIERLYRYVPKDRVRPILLDDIKVNPHKEYLKTLEFLQVDKDRKRNFAVVNQAKERRSMALRKVVQLLGGIKNSLGINRGLGLLNSVDSKNIVERPRAPMPENIRDRLQNYFYEDVKKLGNILGRNLDHWIE